MTRTSVFLEAWVGDDKDIDVTVLNESGGIVDISGSTEITWKMAVDENTVAILSRSQTGPGNITKPGGGTDGIFRIAIDPADTALLASAHYYHEGIVTLPTGITHTITGMFWLRPTIPV